MNHADVARRMLEALGGESNIKAAAHCATRMRLVIDDEELINQAALDDDPDLKGTFSAGGMYQIIVGPGDVDLVYDEFIKLTGNKTVSTEELKDVAAQTGNPVSRAIKVLADIFVPLIPILVGGGLLMALNNILTAENLFGADPLITQFPAIEDFASMINLLAAAPFAFLPVLVGFTATKRFGGNEFLGAGIAMAMVFPSLVNGYEVAETIAEGKMEYWNLFGLDVAQAGYQGTVLPVLLVSWLLAQVEKFLHKRLSGTVDFLVTPVLTLLITGFATFIAVGPAMRWLGDTLAHGLQGLYEFAGPVGGFLFGLVYSLIVITGLHQSFPPVELQLFAVGGSFIFATASVANVAQGAATLAVGLTTRDEKLRGLSMASGLSACFGITEPAIFGVNLRLRWPFYIGMGVAAITGAMIAIFKVKAVALGAAGFIGFVSIKASDIPMFLVCVATSFVLSFAAAYSYAMYLRRKQPVTHAAEPEPFIPEPEHQDAERLASPLTGELIPLANVSDAAFAAGQIGPGFAVIPSEGVLRAPASGKVKVAFPTGHAVAIGTDEGVDVLMHIGFDTVKLEGKGFELKVAKGDIVQQGDVLVEFDLEAIRAAGLDTATPVVISNHRKRGRVDVDAAPGPITAGDHVATVHPKELVGTN
ncbi:sucrose-specific PTS transporter subunit IIBC [Corynebacterium sp.]|uniref:sucrose-specific PTS transporter subunit IIBC n=1 Tax=Corynebacterium sp. TaxID=1720 RepID=UPI0026DA7298|nr:sucrose-specific PTS transporter subunit IIBC [Corynebacterium sp.]MDO5076496.1 sucrose-specific PTS transporter subunit IIBC [Corynebacterium sp.]